jgi:hypothetical protein
MRAPLRSAYPVRASAGATAGQPARIVAALPSYGLLRCVLCLVEQRVES